MIILSYYADVPQIDRVNETRLMLLWKARWEQAGFKPRVLSERDAQRHPYYQEYREAVSKLPSINPATYDYHCFMRWLAVAQLLHEKNERGFMSDYDTMPNMKTWADAEELIREIQPTVVEEEEGRCVVHPPIVCFQNCVPCFVGGDSGAFLAQCHIFARYKPSEGENHTSDMLILEQQAAAIPGSYRALQVAKLWSEPGWEHSPLIHFSNSVCQPAGKVPRWKAIPELLPQP